MISGRYEEISSEELTEMIERADVDNIYYLVDYDGGDIYHCWIRRDEYMYDDEIDNELEKQVDHTAIPKFKRHY